MNKELIIHIITADKFIQPFISLLETIEGFERHRFLICGDTKKYGIKKIDNAIENKDQVRNLINEIKILYNADKIFLHGLFDIRIVAFFMTQPWLLTKTYWVIWGGDLYRNQPNFMDKKQKISWEIQEFIRKFTIKRIGNLVTFLEGDIQLARKIYNAKGRYHECILYPSNIYKHTHQPNTKSQKICIQIGNSADPSNKHFEIFKRLLPFKDENIEVYAPLSYGNPEYAKLVIHEGYSIFGEKFKPLTEMLPISDYLIYLNKIDIAIFNHRRQQAMGNTITLLGLGKKVYMRNDVSPWNLFESIGATVYNIDNLNLNLLTTEKAKKNTEIIKEYFSEKNLIRQLENIFNEKQNNMRTYSK